MRKSRQAKRRGVREKASPQKQVSLNRPEGGDAGTQSFRRGAISIFILFHLIAITCWAMPTEFAPVKAVRELVRPYMIWAGLFQSWDMFAPNPKSINAYVNAAVITRNHHMRVWTFPRMEQLSLSERYRKERYRKFTEVLPEQQYAAAWPDVATHLARSLNNPADPPDEVLLVQFVSEIKPGTNTEPAPKPNVFYEDYVQAEDLK